MIIPVLDLKKGIAVSGQSGQRETYQPLQTVFNPSSPSSDPLEIAGALKEAGAGRLYLADLDSIEGKGSNFKIIQNINQIIPVMMDGGAADVKTVESCLKVSEKVIVATETLKSLKSLEEIFETFSNQEIVISIDIKDDLILSKNLQLSIREIEAKLKELKPDEIILLDISGVGTLNGFNQKLLENWRGWEEALILGGGIIPQDLEILQERGITKFLLGSALHSGQILHPFSF